MPWKYSQTGGNLSRNEIFIYGPVAGFNNITKGHIDKTLKVLIHKISYAVFAQIRWMVQIHVISATYNKGKQIKNCVLIHN